MTGGIGVATPGFDRRDALVMVALGLIAAFLVAWLVPGGSRPVRLGADAGFTYGYLPSVVLDGDLDFSDDAIPFDSSMPHTATGRTHNAFPIGPALWWSPAFVTGHVVGAVVRGVTDGQTPAPDGRTWPYDATVPALAFALGLVGVWATYWLARSFVPTVPAALGTVGVWLAGPAVNVTHERILTSNAAGFAAAALFTVAWVRLRGRQDRLVAVVGLGLLGGLLVLTRWQSSVLLLGPAIDAVRGSLRGRRGPDLVALGVFAATVALAFLPQLLVWDALYGSPLRPPRGEAAGVFLDLSRLHLTDVAFSWRHGALSWHPILAAGLVGLVVMLRRHRLVVGSLLVAVAVLILVNAGILDWWAGASFGQRRFDGVWPALGLGIAVVVHRVPRWLALGAVAVLTVWNSLWHLAFVERVISQVEAVTPADVLAAAGSLSPVAHLDDWSPRKAVWVLTALLVAMGPLAWRAVRVRRVHDHVVGWTADGRLARAAVAGGMLVVLAATAAVGTAATEPGQYDPTVFEAAYFVPQQQRPDTTSRTVRPGEDVWTLVWSFPGFLPAGTYQATVTDVRALDGTARLTVLVDGEPVVAVAPGASPSSATGVPFTLEAGFRRLELVAAGGPVRLDAVRIHPIGEPVGASAARPGRSA